MDLNPQRVRQAEFKTVKRGLDPDEVQRFLDQVADELENAQNQSTAMEARARAAVARLQELSDGAESQAAATTSEDASATAEQVDTISRTLLLAQRTADTTIAQAEAEGERLLAAATEEAATTLDSTREMSARLIEEAREEARKVGESERVAIASEVSSLKARRDFLESDVDHLEQFLVAQRERLREAAASMIELTERVPGGLGEVRRPLLSASDDDDDLDAGPGTGEAVDGADAAVQWDVHDEVDAVTDEAGDEPAGGVAAGVADEGFAPTDDLVAADAAGADGAGEVVEEQTTADAGADLGGDAVPTPHGQEELVITPDIAEFPPEDAAPAADPDATPGGFGIADASGEMERSDDEAGTPARFTFDENP